MKRREFITLIGGAAMACSQGVRAQQPAMPVIGFLHVAFPGQYAQHLVAFRQGLKQSGYVEGQNVAIEYRWANNDNNRLPELAADLVRRQMALIVAAGGSPSALAAKAATSTIPIVLVFGSDPVRLGLAASLNQPGGNVTGVTFLTTELMAKRLELLRELIPQATTIACLADLRFVMGQEMLRDTLAAAGVLGRQIAVVEARSERDFDPAFATFVERQAGALIVTASQLFDSNRDRLVALAALHKMPTIYQGREYVLDGGPDELWRQPGRRLSPGRALCRADSQGRKSSQPAGPAGHEGRARHQPENRKGAWPRSAPVADDTRRRDD
jgi:putative ABC transport system substrate-binding protein